MNRNNSTTMHPLKTVAGGDSVHQRTCSEAPLFLSVNGVSVDTHNNCSRYLYCGCCCGAANNSGGACVARETSARQSAAAGDWQRLLLAKRAPAAAQVVVGAGSLATEKEKAAAVEGLGQHCRRSTDTSEAVAQKLNEILVSCEGGGCRVSGGEEGGGGGGVLNTLSLNARAYCSDQQHARAPIESCEPHEQQQLQVQRQFCDTFSEVLLKGTKKALLLRPNGGCDCDCASCLSEELLQVERRIVSLMIGRQQQRALHPKREAVAETVAPSGASSGIGGSDRGGGPVDGGAAVPQWRYVYVRRGAKGNGGPIESQRSCLEEEFEDQHHQHTTDLQSLAAMVTGGGGGGGGGGGATEMAATNTMTTTEKNAPNTVEVQLSALLTSSSKEVLQQQQTNSLVSSEGKGGTATRTRHTNLIENQLLTLEDQFWKSSSRGSGAGQRDRESAKETVCTTAHGLSAVVLEASEDTALLGSDQQMTMMSDSTPVKRVAMKVTVGSGSSVVLEEDAGGGGGVPRMGLVPSPSTNLSRMKRFEQFLKSLVGKKASAGATQSGGDLAGGRDAAQEAGVAGTAAAFEHPALKVRSSVELKSNVLLTTTTSGGTVEGAREREREKIPTLRRPSFGSMSSLTSAAQQKILNTSSSVLSLSATKRNLSVNNLTTIPERRNGGGGGGGTDAGLFTSRATPACCRNSNNGMRKATRGLKTVSCSFSNFEHLHDAAQEQQQQQIKCGGGGVERRRCRDQLRNGLSGEQEEQLPANGEEQERRDSLHTWRLKVSKSTNHLQSMVMTTASGGGPLRPLNRFRNSLLESSVSQVNLMAEAQCSRCSSILSLAGGTMGKVRCSDSSVTRESSEEEEEGQSVDGREKGQEVIVVTRQERQQQQQTSTVQSCKLCLGEVAPQQLTGISQCRCLFCTDCMRAYIEFEILEGAYEISCPDAMCPSQGVVTMTEIAALTPDLMMKHNRYRLNREVELDKNRTWCPRAGCDTVCLVDGPANQASTSSFNSAAAGTSAMISVIASTSSTGGSGTAATVVAGKNATMVAYAVHCPTCDEEFCSACKKTWHHRLSCEENMKKLAADGHTDSVGIPFDSDLIKCCPMCGVPIEKDEGCAQMMCKRCKHVFCWYCLASLDDDFLLRHYDKGPCKNKLGHSRASVVWHRAQVIGIFAGFGILLLVASPLLLLAAPCIVCCKCRICSGGPKIEEEHEIDFDDPLTTLHGR